MNKRIILVALSVLVAFPVFAQTKLVKQVEKMAKRDKTDLVEARKLLEPALTHPETAEDPHAWYVMGLINEKDVDKDFLAMQLGQQVNEPKFYNNLYDMVRFYLKADELASRPDQKPRVAKKIKKEIEGPLSTYYQFLVNGGAGHLDKQEFKEATKYFDAFMAVKKLPMFEGKPVAAMDSLTMQIGFFNAYAHSQIENNSAKAIAAYEAIKDVDYRQSDVYQLLALEYYKANDTVQYVQTLQEGVNKFPEIDFFLNNLIDSYIKGGKVEAAKQYLDQGLANKPGDANMLYVYGVVYEQGEQNLEKALEYYHKAVAAAPESANINYAVGRAYFNLGVTTRDSADQTNVEEFRAASEKADDYFKKALPFFEKAVNLEPQNREYLSTLSRGYYVLGMEDKRAEVDAKIATL